MSNYYKVSFKEAHDTGPFGGPTIVAANDPHAAARMYCNARRLPQPATQIGLYLFRADGVTYGRPVSYWVRADSVSDRVNKNAAGRGVVA